MPPPQYTRRRRLIMQLVMVIILGCTLGLAAWVRQARVGPSGVPLALSLRFGELKMRMPEWDLKEAKGNLRSDGQLGAQICILGIEPASANSGTRRVLEIYQQDVPQNETPGKYLEDAFKVPQHASIDTIRMLGRVGVLVQVAPSLAQTRMSGNDATESQIFACCVVRTGLAVTVRLRVPGRPVDERDVALVRQVAKTLQLLDLYDDN